MKLKKTCHNFLPLSNKLQMEIYLFKNPKGDFIISSINGCARNILLVVQIIDIS